MDVTNIEYDVAIIGAGMIGSAAAKYASEDVKTSILIGPDQPQDGIHSAWFDEGRIVEKLDQHNANWIHLGAKSIERFRKIESASGVDFYQEVGFLSIAPKFENEEFLDQQDYQKVDKMEHLSWPQNCEAIFQPQNAGHISPRNLVKAQKVLAGQNNCQIISDALVTKITKPEESCNGFYTIICKRQNYEKETKIKAKKVILAPGAYTNMTSLISLNENPDLEPDLTLTTQTVAYLEVPVHEAQRLNKMPALCTDYDFKKLDGTYILPPILYPDGKYYLKLGHGDHFEIIIQNLEEMKNWYKNGNGVPEAVETLASFITESLIPTIKVLSVTGGCCVTSNTVDKLAPYIEEVYPGFVLATGGCGYAAKGSDEIGRIAAKLCTKGQWTCPEISQTDTKIRWRTRQNKD